MAKGYYLVLGDKTTCGGMIIGGDTTYTLLGKPVAREQEQVTCGRYPGIFIIVGHIPCDSVKSRKFAGTLHSKSSCPCQSRLIPSILTNTYERASAVISNAPGQHAQTAKSAYENKGNPGYDQILSAGNVKIKEEEKQEIICHHSDGAIDVANYIVAEIKNNVRSDTAERIRELIDKDIYQRKLQEWKNAPWYLRLSPPPRPDVITASMIWFDAVKTGGKWDHKPKIKALFKKDAIARPLRSKKMSSSYYHKYKNNDYFYDVWSNIHYGYVGLSVGFSQDYLLLGSSVEQIRTSVTSEADPIDDVTCMKIGFRLYHQYGKYADALTDNDVLEALENASDYELSESRSIHWCWNEKNSEHIEKDL